MRTTTKTIAIRGLGRRAMSELAAQARAAGMTPAKYARQLVEERLAIVREARTRTFAEIMGPGQVVDERELDKLVEESKGRHHRRTKG